MYTAYIIMVMNKSLTLSVGPFLIDLNSKYFRAHPVLKRKPSIYFITSELRDHKESNFFCGYPLKTF